MINLNQNLETEEVYILHTGEKTIHDLRNEKELFFDQVQIGDYLFFENGVGIIAKKEKATNKIIIHSFVKNNGEIKKGTMQGSPFFYNSIGYINKISENPDKIIFSYGWDEEVIPNEFIQIKEKISQIIK